MQNRLRTGQRIFSDIKEKVDKGLYSLFLNGYQLLIFIACPWKVVHSGGEVRKDRYQNVRLVFQAAKNNRIVPL